MDGINNTGDRIGMVCDAHLRTPLLLLPYYTMNKGSMLW